MLTKSQKRIIANNPKGYCRAIGRPLNHEEAVFLFWSRIDKKGPNGCWLWTWRNKGEGYGNFKLWGKSQHAHRISYILKTGEKIPKRNHLCHKCDNPRCVNPKHMFVGTPADNWHDAVRKGRIWKGGKRLNHITRKFEYVN